MPTATSSTVLVVADLFHPVDDLTVELFLNGDMRHGCRRRSPMPVLLARRNPDHVTGPDFFDGAAPTLRPTATGGHDQGLTQRMRVPRCSSAGFECDTGAQRACGSVCLEQGIYAHRAGKPIGRSFAGRL
jgi:hypothetical protein